MMIQSDFHIFRGVETTNQFWMMPTDWSSQTWFCDRAAFKECTCFPLGTLWWLLLGMCVLIFWFVPNRPNRCNLTNHSYLYSYMCHCLLIFLYIYIFI
jgi:hypothetical protein